MPKKKQTDIEQLEFTLPAEEKEYPIEQSELYQKILEGNKTAWTPQYCRKNGLLFHGDSLDAATAEGICGYDFCRPAVQY